MVYKNFKLKSSKQGVEWYVTATNKSEATDIIITHSAIEMRAIKEIKAKIDERETSDMELKQC